MLLISVGMSFYNAFINQLLVYEVKKNGMLFFK